MMLDLRGVTGGYGAAPVLHGVDLAVRAGETVAVLGPNGAGKSTLLGAITGTIRHRAGSIRFADEEIVRRPSHGIVGAGLVLAPEGRQIFAPFTVADNLRRTRPRRLIPALVEEFLENGAVPRTRLPGPLLIASDGTVIDANEGGQSLLGKAERLSFGPEPVSKRLRLWEGIVAEVSDKARMVPDGWIGTFLFPVANGAFVQAEPLGHLILQQSELQAPLLQVLAECSRVLRTRTWFLSFYNDLDE